MIDKNTIAARVSIAVNNTNKRFKIYKTYVRNIRLIEERAYGAEPFSVEQMFTFEHKGKTYVLTDDIVGNKAVSAKHCYRIYEV